MENRRFINIHCHGLYGVDDGPENIEASKALLDMAIGENIGTIILTPHFDDRMDAEIREKAEEAFHRLRKAYPQLKLHLGSEIFYNSSTINYLEEGKAMTMAGTKYVLVEFDFDSSYQGIYEAVKTLVINGYKPIIAHVERYTALFGKEERISKLSLLGGYIQINSRSFVGWKINKRRRWAVRLLKDGYVDFVADDSHDHQLRKPLMKEIYDKLAKEIDRNTLEKVFYQNPKALLNREVI